MLYDFATHKQTVVYHGSVHYPDPCWRLRDRKVERILNYTEQRLAGNGKGWFALAPGEQVITTRSVGTEEIYALDWIAP